jgi:hypothetical protein
MRRIVSACRLASAAAEMLDQPEEIGAKRRLLSQGSPGFDQSFFSRVSWSDLPFPVVIVTEEIGHRRVEGGGDPPEPVDGDSAASFLEIGESTR